MKQREMIVIAATAFIAISGAAAAKDGTRWANSCFIYGPNGNVYSASCNDANVSCSGGNGSSCTINGISGVTGNGGAIEIGPVERVAPIEPAVRPGVVMPGEALPSTLVPGAGAVSR